MAESKNDYAGGDKIIDTDLNQIADNSNDGGGFRDDLDAGETINGGTLPVAIYQDTSDNEVYACDGNDTDKLQFFGFAISNSTDGNAIEIQTDGVVDGFSALDEGELYYVQDDKTIGTSKGTYPVLVGRAISTTEIAIIKEMNTVEMVAVASDNLVASADTERSTTTVSPSWDTKKRIYVYRRGTIRMKFDLRTPSITVRGQIWINGVAAGTLQSTVSATYVTKSEDIDVEYGDEVILRLQMASSGTGYTRNFRFYFDDTPNDIYTVDLD